MFDMILLGFEQVGGVVVNGDRCDFIAGSVEFAAVFAGVVLTGYFADDVEAVGDLAEDRVAVVEEGCGRAGDEELGAVGIGASVCHRENAGRAVAELGVEFIGKLVARAAAAGFGGIAALEHEALNDAVEGDVVVVSPAGEIEKIRASERSLGCVERGIDVASGGVDGDFDVGHGREVNPERSTWQGGRNFLNELPKGGRRGMIRPDERLDGINIEKGCLLAGF